MCKIPVASGGIPVALGWQAVAAGGKARWQAGGNPLLPPGFWCKYWRDACCV